MIATSVTCYLTLRLLALNGRVSLLVSFSSYVWRYNCSEALNNCWHKSVSHPLPTSYDLSACRACIRMSIIHRNVTDKLREQERQGLEQRTSRAVTKL